MTNSGCHRRLSKVCSALFSYIIFSSTSPEGLLEVVDIAIANDCSVLSSSPEFVVSIFVAKPYLSLSSSPLSLSLYSLRSANVFLCRHRLFAITSLPSSQLVVKYKLGFWVVKEQRWLFYKIG
ncbi:hypothetical protein AAHE18_17G227400 [Arachis hypogaea]